MGSNLMDFLQLNDQIATAYHEAGHAIVGAIRGRPPISITIIQDGYVAGKNEFPEDWRLDFMGHLNCSREKRCYIETRILTAVAGTIAHDLLLPGRAHDAGDAFDKQHACKLIMESAGWADDDRKGYFQQLQENARHLLQENWSWVEAVANALIKDKKIQMAQIMELRPNE